MPTATDQSRNVPVPQPSPHLPTPFPPATTSGFALYVPEASAPESVKALPPDELARWFHSTLYAEIVSPNFGGIDKALNRDRATFAQLHITLANEAYKREKGKYPETVEELVGPYLKALPEDYVSTQ